MAGRHVREGEARQEAVVVEWNEIITWHSAVRGRELLEVMHLALDLAKDHLRNVKNGADS